MPRDAAMRSRNRVSWQAATRSGLGAHMMGFTVMSMAHCAVLTDAWLGYTNII